MVQVDRGRVPRETVDLLERSVQQARQVATAVPAQASAGWADVAYSAVLTVMLRDWVENSNTDGMLDQDLADLQAIVRVSAAIALEQDYVHRDSTFKIVLTASLGDWLSNWNAD